MHQEHIGRPKVIIKRRLKIMPGFPQVKRQLLKQEVNHFLSLDFFLL